LVVDNVSDQNITLSWKPPANDGGSMITNYIVERMECTLTAVLPGSGASATAPQSADVQSWSRCTMTKNLFFTDELVESNHRYQYRVVAQNLQGRSQPCEPTSVVTVPEAKSRIKRWTEDENGKRRRGKDGFAPSDYDKCCKASYLIYLSLSSCYNINF
jgi:hypothetical protein